MTYVDPKKETKIHKMQLHNLVESSELMKSIIAKQLWYNNG